MEGGILKKKKLITSLDRAKLLEGEQLLSVDMPAQYVSRISLNSPQNGNLMNNRLRAQLLEQIQLNDQDPDVRVTILRGNGDDFCLGSEPQRSMADALPTPFFTDESDGQITRNQLQNWFLFQDMSKPIIAEVHGKCLGIGFDLCLACDLVYSSKDCELGYPEIRNFGLPDFNIYPYLTGMRNSLSMLLLSETQTGETAKQKGLINDCFENEVLSEKVLEIAKRVSKIPSDLLSFNKRSVYRAFEAQGMRNYLRHSVDFHSLMFHSSSSQVLRRAEQKALSNIMNNKKQQQQQQQSSQNVKNIKTETRENKIKIESKPKEAEDEKFEAKAEGIFETTEKVVEEEEKEQHGLLNLILSEVSNENDLRELLNKSQISFDIHLNEPLKVHFHNENIEETKIKSKL